MLLLSADADVNQVTLSGLTPLHLACQSRADVCVFAILSQTKQFVMVDLEDDHRKTPRHLTGKGSRGEAARWLLDEYKDSRGKLASRCAKNVKPQLSTREFRSIGHTLRAIVNGAAQASTRLNMAIQ